MLPRAWRLYSRGQRLQGRGRIAEAADALEQSLELLDWDSSQPPKLGTSKARLTARVLTTRALTLAISGQAPAGLELLDEADDFVDERDRGILFHQRAVILYHNGRIVDALDWFEQAEPILERHGPDWLHAALFHNRSAAWRDLGEFEKSLLDVQRAQVLFAAVGNHVHRAKARHAEALLWLDLGEIIRAITVFDAVSEEYREYAPEMESFVNDAYAEALRRVGLHRQAGERWAEAISAWRFHGNLMDAALAEYRRAVVAYEEGDVEAAVSWAQHAMESLYEQRNEPWAFLARLLILQAQFDAGQDGPDFPTKVRMVSGALESRGWTRRLGQVKVLEARAHIRAGELDKAGEILAQPMATNDSEALTGGLALHLARAELAESRALDPLPELRAGLSMLDQYRSEFGSVEFQVGVSALGRDLANMGLRVAADSGHPSTMLSWAERSRAQALRISPVKSSANPEARETLGRLRQARQRLWDAQLEGQDDAKALQRVHDLEQQIRIDGWSKAGPGHQSERVPPAKIHALAEERGTAVINLFAHGGNLHAVLAGVGELRHVRLAPKKATAELGRRLGADLDALAASYLPERLRTSVEASLRRDAMAMYKAIWDPIAEFVGDRPVVIVPHSLLAWVPWSLLPPFRGRPVTVAPSAEAWWRAANRPPATGPAIIAAGPALKTAEGEIKAIAECYPGARLIAAEDSDPEEVLAALDGASTAHLAAHGHHERDNVLFSRLDFRGGPLNAYELLNLEQAPSHVVLSSCDLGRSNVAVGNETLGFTAALLHAGTSTVVSCLGRVPDELSAEMMIDYHRRCAAGATPAEALAAAGEKQPWHPFVCFGA